MSYGQDQADRAAEMIESGKPIEEASALALVSIAQSLVESTEILAEIRDALYVEQRNMRRTAEGVADEEGATSLAHMVWVLAP